MTQDTENQTPQVVESSGNGHAATDATQTATKASVKKSRPTKLLPTDRIAPAKQIEILRAWAAASGQAAKTVTNNDVAAIVGLAASTVSLANPFFVENGLLQKVDGGFVPSADVMNFARAHEWNPDTAAQKLAPTLTEAWFSQAIIPRLSFRTLDERDAIQILADTVAAGPEFEDQLRSVLFFMNAAGVVSQDGQVIRLARAAASPPAAAAEKTPAPVEAAVGVVPPAKGTVSTAFQQQQEGAVQFHISVKVDMKEFATWSPELVTRFFGGIAEVLRAKAEVERGGRD